MKKSPLQTVVLATHNRGKAVELAVLLEPFQVEVLSLDSFPHVGEVEETGTTFEENALLKAVEVSKATGLVAIADDSGLSVDALGGVPGVYSARYSAELGIPATDERNIDKLLSALENVPDEKRTGYFSCVMAAATPTGETLVAEGRWCGFIGHKRQGENGFGYDPLFVDPELGQTAAQMPKEIKNSRSHRAKAVGTLLEKWPAFWQQWVNNPASK